MLTARRGLAPSLLVLGMLGVLVGWGGIMRAVGSPPADEAAARPADAPGSGGKVLVANETSGTVSVIDAATNTVVGTVCLGSDPAIPDTPQPNGPCNAEADHHKPLYNGHIAPHGLWLTPDGSLLLVTNRLSGTIVGVNTSDNSMLGYTAVEREPHLTTVRPGGQEAWVAVRGESQLDILGLHGQAAARGARGSGDRPQVQTRRGDLFPTIDTVDTVLGPSMVSFTSDGRFAFVVSAKQRLVQKIDADQREVVASQPVTFPFTPFGLVSPDDQELFVIHKLAGKLSVLRTSDLSFVVQDLDIGPCANHVFFIRRFAYITIGGPTPCAPAGGPQRQGDVVILDRATHQIVRRLANEFGDALKGDPHGIWGTADGRRLFVGRESANKVTVIDNADNPSAARVVATIDVDKQPIDVVVTTNPSPSQP